MDIKFTKQFPITKTLRFELRPYGTTQQFLEDSGIIQKDRQRSEDFKELKIWLDDLHKEFIEDALQNVSLDQDLLRQAMVLWQKKDKKELKVINDQLRKPFREAFTLASKRWQDVHATKKDPLFSEAVLTVLEQKYPDAAKVAGEFKGFVTYLEPFFDNRKHMYAVDGKASQIATRSINENLFIFLRNAGIAEAPTYVEMSHAYDDLFELDGYHRYLSQSSINDYNEKIGVLNKRVNELRQNADKTTRRSLPLFRRLHKQILSDRQTGILHEPITDNDELLEVLKLLQTRAQSDDLRFKEIVSAFFESRDQLGLDLRQIYITRQALNTISNSWLEEWSILRDILPDALRARPKTNEQKRLMNFVTLQDITDSLDTSPVSSADFFNSKDQLIASALGQGSAKSENFLHIWALQLREAKDRELIARKAISVIKTADSLQAQDSRQLLKTWLDARLAVERMLRWWRLEYDGEAVTDLERDERFYELLDAWWEVDFVGIYNRIRNYLTKKPYSLDKWKLNFNTSTLMNGWDRNKESDNLAVLLEKEGAYYVAIMNRSHGTKAFSAERNPRLYVTDSSQWRKVDYKQLTQIHMALPKGFFAPTNIRSAKNPKGMFEPPNEEIIRIREQETFKKSNFVKQDLVSWIDFMKARLSQHRDWKDFTFHFKDSNHYKDVSEFYFDVEKDAYRLSLLDINGTELEKMVAQEDIYLFEIANKDLQREPSKEASRNNLHTSYFLQAFKQENITSPIKTKLNGQAEVFFRPASIEAKTENRGHKDIIVNKRFTEDKIFFHVPITINFGAKPVTNTEFNTLTRQALSNHKTPIRIIGIDRGEKHLAYVAICDENGNLVEQPISLNNALNGIPYHALLSKRADELKEASKEWDAARSIKELKAGFVGHAAKYIVDLAVKHNAILVMEDLNFGFKRGRLFIGHSVYQRFESALLAKLQYYVDKQLPAHEPASVANGIQLAPPSIEPQDIQKQMGWVLFTRAAYTSAVDPVSGFRSCFRLTGTDFAKVLAGFDEIYFDEKSKEYRFTFSWQRLAKAISSNSKNAYPEKVWRITANVDRLRWSRSAGDKSGETILLNPMSS